MWSKLVPAGNRACLVLAGGVMLRVRLQKVKIWVMLVCRVVSESNKSSGVSLLPIRASDFARTFSHTWINLALSDSVWFFSLTLVDRLKTAFVEHTTCNTLCADWSPGVYNNRNVQFVQLSGDSYTFVKQENESSPCTVLNFSQNYFLTVHLCLHAHFCAWTFLHTFVVCPFH